MKILVVCLGNICRSPMAEGILRSKIKEKKLVIVVDSAGTADYHVGESPDARAIATSKKFGIDISSLRGRQFIADDFDRFDFIYAMDHSNYNNIKRLARNSGDIKKIFFFYTKENNALDVPDPWFGGPEGFIDVFDILEESSDRILSELQTL